MAWRLASELTSTATPLKPAALKISLNIAMWTGSEYSGDGLGDTPSSFVGAGENPSAAAPVKRAVPVNTCRALFLNYKAGKPLWKPWGWACR